MFPEKHVGEVVLAIGKPLGYRKPRLAGQVLNVGPGELARNFGMNDFPRFKNDCLAEVVNGHGLFFLADQIATGFAGFGAVRFVVIKSRQVEIGTQFTVDSAE